MTVSGGVSAKPAAAGVNTSAGEVVRVMTRNIFLGADLGPAFRSPGIAEFIAANGTDVTDAFRLYLRPLLGSGMPDASRLRLNKVDKILKPGK